MTRLGVPTEVDTAVDQPHVTYLLFIELALDSGTQRLVSAPHDVDWDGFTWTAAQGLGTIEPLQETGSQARGLAFTLSHVPAGALASAMDPNLQGRPVKIHFGVLDAAGTLQVDRAVWQGSLDVASIKDGASSGVIRFTAEHAGIAWQQSSGLLMSHEDQQVLHPGDKFFEYGAQMSEAVITWPGKEFFRQ